MNWLYSEFVSPIIPGAPLKLQQENFFDNQYVYVDWGPPFLYGMLVSLTATPPYFRTSTGRIALDLILNAAVARLFLSY